MTDTSFMDFDAVAAEEGPLPESFATFTLAEQDWTVNLRLNAGLMLRWMRQGSKVEGIPILLDALMGDEEVIKLEDALIDKNIDFTILEKTIVWLAEQMKLSGSGN